MMMMSFEIGRTYENREGTFEVVSVSGSDMVVRINGTTKTYDIAIQAKICENIAAERQTMALTLGLKDMAWLVGAIASRCRIKMEVRKEQFASFRRQYEKATGTELPTDAVYVREGREWANATRIFVPLEVATHPRFTIPCDVVPVDTDNGLIISNNRFFWHLVNTFGIRAANQDLNEIEAEFPEAVRADFRAGCALS